MKLDKLMKDLELYLENNPVKLHKTGEFSDNEYFLNGSLRQKQLSSLLKIDAVEFSLGGRKNLVDMVGCHYKNGTNIVLTLLRVDCNNGTTRSDISVSRNNDIKANIDLSLKRIKISHDPMFTSYHYEDNGKAKLCNPFVMPSDNLARQSFMEYFSSRLSEASGIIKELIGEHSSFSSEIWNRGKYAQIHSNFNCLYSYGVIENGMFSDVRYYDTPELNDILKCLDEVQRCVVRAFDEENSQISV